ncbi:MAG: methyltransferase domain-containing protein [Candidatus Wallbacteria bacterium]|nr:methyltransferase domain-containing protein [Candidatus Wallbacteria bacterium]
MRRVPRHLFVPPELIEQAYEDHPLPIGCDQTISQPYIVALMSDAVLAGPGRRLLDIGTGSGYQCAVLAQLGASVITVELFPHLAARAGAILRHLHYTDAHCVIGDGSHPGFLRSRFDGIVVAAAAPEVPSSLCDLLNEGAHLVIPVGEPGLQQLMRIRRRGHRFTNEILTSCVFVPLRGARPDDRRPSGGVS